ncbi:hypothetical protein [Saccharopolyspora shandongensis]|uniref:hypothetical protein n=1 Tax=Saccharopolyspora shandongensis TaxID=418495 RepID=UPI0015A6D129|nr:hypothetical protein [Saccharopolyspora shandongensis]
MTMPTDGTQPERTSSAHHRNPDRRCRATNRPPVPASASLGQLISGIVSQNPEASEIKHVATATALAAALNHTARQLVEHFVKNARRDGRPWSAIAAVLDVSKQAAHKRFVPRVTNSLPANRTAHRGDTT